MSNPLLDALSFVGNVVDTPGSIARGLGSAAVRGIGGDYENAGRDLGRAFSGILDPSQRVYGSEWTGDPWTGMAADIATDPLNLIGGLGILKTAGKAKKALAANDAAMQTLATAFKEAKEVGPWTKATARPSYIKAMEEAASLPKRNPMLKMPLSEAAAKAKAMSRDDFVFGPVKGEAPPLSYFSNEAGQYAAAAAPEELVKSWETIASRYPRTAAKYANVAQDANGSARFLPPNQMANLGLPNAPGIAMNKGAFGYPDVLLHELVHAGQHASGKMQRLANTGGMTQAGWDLALEPTAFRRNIEAQMANGLYDYGNALQRVPTQTPLVAALGGYNAARTGAYL